VKKQNIKKFTAICYLPMFCSINFVYTATPYFGASWLLFLAIKILLLTYLYILQPFL